MNNNEEQNYEDDGGEEVYDPNYLPSIHKINTVEYRDA
jgi:hypothetical protein